MSHLILDYDLTGSISGREWMGLAVVPPGNTREEKIDGLIRFARENLLFPLVTGESICRVGDREIPLVDEEGNGWKTILADCANMPHHAERAIHPPILVPLHQPKQGYEPLENGRFFDIAVAAFEKLGLKFQLETCGTLGNLKRFYFCVAMDEFRIKTPDGNPIQSYLNFLSSHDGFIVPTVKDWHSRVVCANTFAACSAFLSDFVLTGKHTENGLKSLENLGDALERFGKGIEATSKAFEQIGNVSTNREHTREIVAGFFVSELVRGGKRIADDVSLTSNAYNAIEEITQLSRTGTGNAGATLYDTLNGATEYWTHGNGAGSSRVGIAKRYARGMFGEAANYKEQFVSFLTAPDRDDCAKVGAQALANKERQLAEKN